MDPPDNRRVKHAIRAWKADVLGKGWPANGPIVPGEPVLIEPSEEIHVLCWTDVKGETMALISLCWTLYLVAEEDLEERTMRVFKAGR